MDMKKGRMGLVLRELGHHAPFTLLGAVTGIACLLVFRHATPRTAHGLFLVFHPAHVLLSAMVTASLFKLRQGTRNFFLVLLIGYTGSIGVATLSDCILPYFGEDILGVAVPTESKVHSTEGAEAHEAGHEGHGPDLHLGFIEEWYIVNPAAILGIILAYFVPHTKLPHALHILISTWASAAHILMNMHVSLSPMLLVGVFVVLFVAVWLPCCVSDIVFPMLFVKGGSAEHTCLSCGHDHEREGRA
ncbi:MAG: hypothetical protein KBE04_15585 [Phycisphaerae bacterium]|nr:hypothetical protein [Phycisphaerae bacterium]